MKGMTIMKRFIKRILLTLTAAVISITSIMPIFANAEFVSRSDWVEKYGSAVAFKVEITDSLKNSLKTTATK